MAVLGSGDPVAFARAVALGLAASVLLAVLEAPLRQAIWAAWHLCGTLFAFLARVTLALIAFLSQTIGHALDGLAQEGQSERDGEGTWEWAPARGRSPRRVWAGWLLVGPLVYCWLMLTFMGSDLTVAVLIFEAMGLTLGPAVRSSLPVPLDAAMGVVFVALAAFWGLVLFDLLGTTPFGFMWHTLTHGHRRWLLRLVVTCFLVTVAAGSAMGVWSQAQLRGGLPEPWQTALPWSVRGALVALLICATALSGKPFGSAVAALVIVALGLVRGLSYGVLVLLRLVVILLRESLRAALAVLTLLAFVGHALWNWCAGFAVAERVHIKRLGIADLPEVGGEIGAAEVFLTHARAVCEDNKALIRRLYEDGLLPVELTAQLRDARATIETQVAEGERVVTRFRLTGTRGSMPLTVHGVDESTLRNGSITERWVLLGQPAPDAASADTAVLV